MIVRANARIRTDALIPDRNSVNLVTSMEVQERQMDELFWHQFWKDFPAATDYFSPAIKALQDYLGFGSKDILRSLGEMMGRKVVERCPAHEHDGDAI